MTPAHFTASALKHGSHYRGTAGFKDYDGLVYPAGKSREFKEKHFLPSEDGLKLIVEQGGQAAAVAARDPWGADRSLLGLRTKALTTKDTK